MSILLSKKESVCKDIQTLLDESNNSKGFNVIYSELNLCIDLPKLITKSEAEFLEVINDLVAVEETMSAKYDLKRSFVKEGEVKLEENLTLKLNLVNE